MASGYKVFQANEIEWVLRPASYENNSDTLTQLVNSDHIVVDIPVSYTHLTLPTS